MIPNVFVVIVTYNGAKWVDPCFSSLRQSCTPVKTIVVDNGSTDDTLLQIENRFPEVDVIRSPKNLGFGKANNIGMERAYQQGADYVFLLNQDAWVEPDAVEKIIAAHKAEPIFGILSPMHMNGAGNGLDYNFSTYIAPNKCGNLYSDIYTNRLKQAYEAPFVNAAAWMVTRECIEKVGGFSPSFFHYGEDDNYAQRLQYHGLRLAVVPAAVIYHDREQRPASKFFNPDETFRRDVISRSSNPNQGFSFARECVSICAHLVFSVCRLNLQEAASNVRKLRLILAMDKRAVARNKALSKERKAAFMDLHTSPHPSR
jgi:GT2 family glycosyltransferase